MASLTSFGCDISQALNVVSLSRGLSNQNFLITQASGQYVLRVNSLASNAICSRSAEVANWRAAESGQLAPELMFVSADRQYFLSEFIVTDKDWSELMTANSAHPLIDNHQHWGGVEEQLLSLLNRLSQLPAPDNHISASEQWQTYLTSLSQCAIKHEPDSQWQQRYLHFLTHQTRVKQILAMLDSCMLSAQYCHRDLNPHNLLLKDNRLYCIDFEYACLSHPLTDLASVLATHRLSTPQRHWLISQYLSGHPHLTQDALTAVPAAIELYWYFACCWGLLMASHVQQNLKDTGFLPMVIKGQTPASYLACYDDCLALLS
nr:phosphotransferase [Shewanella sp. Isolate11]